MAKRSDEVREVILNFLYDVHKKARSRNKIRIAPRKLKTELKKRGLSEREIVSNLDYLIQTGWAKAEIEEIEFKTPRGFIRKVRREYYKISDVGINYFEGPSKFQRVEKSFLGINLTNIGNITVIGNIVVNTQYVDLYRDLSHLSDLVRASTQLSDEEKLNYAMEIETIKNQLSKPAPDRDIIRLAWEKLKVLATVAGISSFFEKLAKLIELVL